VKSLIRAYRPSDRQGLQSCIEELQSYIAILDPLKRSRSDNTFASAAYVRYTLAQVRKSNGKIFVAEADNQIIGCIVGIIPEHTELDELEGYPTKDGYILELIVRTEHRKSGIGMELMKTMEKYFSARECTGVLVDCFAPNTKAHDFYRKAGYTDRMQRMLKLL